MTWLCRLVKFEPGMHPHNGTLKVGDMFFGPFPNEVEDSYWTGILRFYVRHLSEYYRTYNSARRPLFVVLPGLNLFCVDQQSVHGGKWIGGWKVYGSPPNLTLSPSINLHGLYHGWIRGGIITPDCEGRMYNEDGRMLK